MLGGVLYSDEKKEYFIIYSRLKGRGPQGEGRERRSAVLLEPEGLAVTQSSASHGSIREEGSACEHSVTENEWRDEVRIRPKSHHEQAVLSARLDASEQPDDRQKVPIRDGVIQARNVPVLTYLSGRANQVGPVESARQVLIIEIGGPKHAHDVARIHEADVLGIVIRERAMNDQGCRFQLDSLSFLPVGNSSLIMANKNTQISSNSVFRSRCNHEMETEGEGSPARWEKRTHALRDRGALHEESQPTSELSRYGFGGTYVVSVFVADECAVWLEVEVGDHGHGYHARLLIGGKSGVTERGPDGGFGVAAHGGTVGTVSCHALLDEPLLELRAFEERGVAVQHLEPHFLHQAFSRTAEVGM